MPSRALQWLSLVGIIWLQSINGTNFNFPSYSTQLKQLLSMSQLQLNNLAFASDAGKLFGFFSGIATVYLPLWLVLIIGSTLGFVGYGVQYLFIADQIHSLSYWHIFFLTVVAGNSICWINTVCYMVAIRNFPCNRQVAVGISNSYQGLSAKIYTNVVDSLFRSSSFKRAEAFLLLNSTLPLGVCLLAAAMARDINMGERESRNMEVGFAIIFVITIATGVFAVLTSVGLLTSVLSPLSCLIGMAVFLLLPLVIPVVEQVKETVQRRYINKERRVFNLTMEDQINGGDDAERRSEEGHEIKLERISDYDDSGGVGVMEEIGVKVMVKRINFWLYFCVYLFGATLGLVFLNNLGQIAESRQTSNISSLVSLSSSFGFYGRLLPSIVDYFCSRRKYMISRAGSIAALMGAMCGAFFLLISPNHHWLYASTAIIAACTGAITSISVSTTSELFGMKNFSVNHNVVVANIPLGSFVFGSLAAFVYHREAAAPGKCIGVECYRLTFLIWGSLCLVGTLLAVILWARTRKFYSRKL